ncbi:MAG: leucine-rich repeat domain-containing protein [Acidobacteriota bacterium]
MTDRASEEFALWKIRRAKRDGLQSLVLRNHRLSVLPSEIAGLTHLQSLDLRNNSLPELPSEIVGLTHLQSLDLRDNRLSELPPEIGRLNRLETLRLSNNRLYALPPEIGGLTRLKTVSLNYNRLSGLPSEVIRLTQLQELHLNGCSLPELPSEIGRLTQLLLLALNDTKLSQLPPEIGRLTALRELWLHDNNLSELPSEIGRLIQLQRLYLSGNPLGIPDEIVASNDAARILGYYFQEGPETEARGLLRNAEAVQQVGNQGSSAKGEKSATGETGAWYEVAQPFDASELAAELTRLATALQLSAAGSDQLEAALAVSRARDAADAGDTSKALEHLEGAGKWAFDTARSLGSRVAAKAIAAAAGLG